ncbi:peptidase M16 domain protein [Asticcacaulis biprosthecium C19]|uniref:Peptidase M16 domain protein n=1 Tax=Asticcacaulis biprosthecium C19 TaxID=715226 RepID=F4QP52_9CAUL|nr:peptidase M16 domain protein [Asticcacaulis biprosthecium C19]
MILGEERMRASAASRAQQVWLEAAYPGGLYPQRNPIGTLDSIRTAPRQALVDYYQDWYRPDLAVLVVVGDFDVAGMEKRIRAVFGDWKAARPGPVRRIDYAPKPMKRTSAVVHTEKNLNESVGAAWIRSYIDRPDSLESRTTGYLKQVALMAMNVRFQRAAEDPASPFVTATVGYDNTREGETLPGCGWCPSPAVRKRLSPKPFGW